MPQILRGRDDQARLVVGVKRTHLDQARAVPLQADAPRLGQLFGNKNGTKRSGGPVSKARRVFEEVSKFPRHKQQRILSVVQVSMNEHVKVIQHEH